MNDRDPARADTSTRSLVLLDERARAASLAAMLARHDRRRAIWVFGYGSLIWNPEFDYDHKARGLVYGFHRSLCLWSRIYRGTPERPGLVLGLEPGGSVHGVAFRLPPGRAEDQLEDLWTRELTTGSYLPRWLDVRLADGDRARAIGFVMNREADGYAGEVSRDVLLETVCSAQGRNGTCADYLLSTVRSLADHDIHDHHLATLAREVGVEIDARGRTVPE